MVNLQGGNVSSGKQKIHEVRMSIDSDREANA